MKNFTITIIVFVCSFYLMQAQNRLGVNTNTPASSLSVNGNAAIGATYAGQAAPTNGTIIEGNVGIGTTIPAEKLEVVGNIKSSSLAGAGSRMVVADANGLMSTQALPAAGLTGTGTANYLPKWTSSNVVGNSLLQDNGTSMAIGTTTSAFYLLYAYRQQLTATGDGQHTIYGYRTRNSQNDGTGYAITTSNSATAGFNFWGDLYTFGVGGWSYNDYSRTGGTIGADINGTYWGSLGYRSSGNLNYGVYGSSAYTSGTGLMASNEEIGIGGGFVGGVVGNWSKGNVIGSISKGEMMAEYNVGDAYTAGRNIEVVKVGNARKATFATTAMESQVNKMGIATLVHGEKYVSFGAEFSALLSTSEMPIVTISAIGESEGIYLVSVDRNGFTVKENHNGVSNIQFSWIVMGKRVDTDQAPIQTQVLSAEFEENMNGVMFDDGNKEQSATPIWYDGSNIRFDAIPAKFSPTRPKED